MGLDLSKMFFPFSITNRVRKTSVQKNNVQGTVYNDAVSVPQLLNEASKSGAVRMNYIVPNVATTTGGTGQGNALQLSNQGLHIITPAADSETAKLTKAIQNMIVEVHNAHTSSKLNVFVSEGNTLAGVVDGFTTLLAGETIRFFANTNNNWIIL